MALVACFGWELKAFDFNSAYLNGELDKNEESYMQELPGYESLGEFVKPLLKQSMDSNRLRSSGTVSCTRH
jgi:hypothetical protein